MSASDIGLLVIVLIATAGMSFIVGWCVGTNDMEEQAVKRKFAHYDAQTGKWRWNDEVRP